MHTIHKYTHSLIWIYFTSWKFQECVSKNKSRITIYDLRLNENKAETRMVYQNSQLIEKIKTKI